MSLSTDADVAAAEGDLAALRVHADRLADGFVKRRLARHLETVADEVAAARRALDNEAPVTAWGGFAVGGWGDDDTDVRAAPPPKKRPKHRYDAWDRSLDAPRRGNWDD